MLTTQKVGRGIVLALIATCAALGVALVGTEYIVSSQGDVAARVAAQTQQVAQLARFPAQLAATEMDFRNQAAVPRGTLTARFTQAMSQLDASANAIARNYPDGSATRIQFNNLYGDLRSRYDAAYRALSEDLAGNRRSSDYFVVHADGINQSSQMLSTTAAGLMEDQLRQLPLQAQALANAGGRMSEMWFLAGLAVLGIMCAYGLVVSRSAGKVMRLADAVRHHRTVPVAASEPEKEATPEAARTRPPVAAADLPRLIDEAIPTALAGELKTGVLFIAMTNLDALHLDHTGEEVEDLQLGVRDSIAAALRPSDVVARLGEGEYGILLAEMRQRDDFVPIEQRIRRAINFAQMRFPQFAGKDIALRSNSAMYPIDGYRGADLLRSARAMGQTNRNTAPADEALLAAAATGPHPTPDSMMLAAPQAEQLFEAAPAPQTVRKPIDRSDRDDLIFT
ncbi:MULTISPECIES: diguanylate cyclase [unclassified Beijerinckia]|uniref:diguanylate cyclase domain-containing protein n=1 Tax=unclassified Beijerinckia TaxID=2638183 RepID=UPI00147DDC0F|nr:MULTISPECIES: diguanylate cyclase [unclassified Beijerinckia]